MDTGLVGEGTEARDVVVERNVDLDVIGDELLNLLELLEVVLAQDLEVCQSSQRIEGK
jgi:hypothetical protein